MPVRRTAATSLAEDLLGVHVWNDLGVEPASQGTYDQAVLVGDAIFTAVVAAVDWARVLIEAAIIHETRSCHRNLDLPLRVDTCLTEGDGTVCGVCLRDALLANAGYAGSDHLDWAAAVPALLDKRRSHA